MPEGDGRSTGTGQRGGGYFLAEHELRMWTSSWGSPEPPDHQSNRGRAWDLNWHPQLLLCPFPEVEPAAARPCIVSFLTMFALCAYGLLIYGFMKTGAMAEAWEWGLLHTVSAGLCSEWWSSSCVLSSLQTCVLKRRTPPSSALPILFVILLVSPNVWVQIPFSLCRGWKGNLLNFYASRLGLLIWKWRGWCWLAPGP